MELFTDASYCQLTGVGVISIDIYENDSIIHELDYYCNDVNISELETMGVQECINYVKSNKLKNYTIYTDHIGIKGKNIIWIKGHSKQTNRSPIRNKFRRVDKRSRHIMRNMRNNYRHNLKQINKQKCK